MSVLTVVPFLVGGGIVLNGVRLRGRLRRLDTAPASGRPAAPEHEFLLAEAVTVSEAARRAASNYATREGLEVLDLVPAGFTIERSIDIARMVDTRTYRADRMARGRGAFQALLVHRSVLDRAGIVRREGFDRVELVEITALLKRYAPVTTDLAVVEGVRPAPDDLAQRLRVHRAAYRWEPVRTYLPNIRDTLNFVGVLSTFPWGLLTSILYWLQPFLVCAGRVPIRPRDLYLSPVNRILAGIDYLVGLVREQTRTKKRANANVARGLPANPEKTRKKAEAEARRARYQAEIQAGVGRYLEPPRETCPWCGSPRLTARLERAHDVMTRKPGTFRYDRCLDCDHIFQNPRLNLAGLEFYYRDVYDGANAAAAEEVLASSVPAHRERAKMMRAYAAPRAWLDVGGGHGHFCNVARDVWPNTVFDILDSSGAVEEAVRRRWADHGYRGMFPDLGDDIAGRYDVISMFHYLEHTREPYLELDTATKALRAGGHLFIEVPNAHSPASAIFRSWWIGWFTPQHQHFPPADNLVAALRQRGLTPVRIQFGRAHQGGGTSAAVFFAVTRVAPVPSFPWLPRPPSVWRWIRFGAVLTLATPFWVVAAVVEALSRPYFRSGRRATAYRVIARKEG